MVQQQAGTVAISLAGIGKRFPGVVALDDVDLELHRGEIHALLGENGAGKSTLIKIMTGVQASDSGEFRVGGEPAVVASPKDAARLGITAVPQDILMVPELSIGRNILLGLETGFSRRGRLSRAERAVVDGALAKVGASYDSETKTADLSVPHLRLAQIARALVHPGEVMILDEPTAVLSEPDAEQLMERLQRFRAEGKAILYVTHRLSEVMRLADRITILRDGRRVGVFRRGEVDRADIVRLMAKEVAAVASSALSDALPVRREEIRLSVSGLTAGQRFIGVDITAGSGQIIGIAGVQGSGHGHFLRALAGADPSDGGRITLDGREIRRGSVRRAVSEGMILVPADRRGSAIVPHLSLRSNLAISGRVRAGVRRFGLRWHAGERRMMREYIDRLSIRPASTEARIGSLSGGNQQKVAIARAIEARAKVLLVEEPTQGVDVGAKAEIHNLLRRIARDEGCTVIVATSEFEELIGLAQEIHVMRSGRLVARIPGPEATYHRILESALA